MTKNSADQKPTRPESAESEQGIPDSMLELIARLDPAFFTNSAARRALALDRPVSLGRHRRQCSICRHPDRNAIELAFLHWHSPEDIAAQFGLPDWSSVYRHVRAFGLFAERRRNARYALESIIERVHEIQEITPSSFVAAVRTYTHISQEGEWVEPPRYVVMTHVKASGDSLVQLAPSPRQAEEGPAAEAETATEPAPPAPKRAEGSPRQAEEGPAPGPASPQKVEDSASSAGNQGAETYENEAQSIAGELEKHAEEPLATQNGSVSDLSNRKSSLQSRKVNSLETKEGS